MAADEVGVVDAIDAIQYFCAHRTPVSPHIHDVAPPTWNWFAKVPSWLEQGEGDVGVGEGEIVGESELVGEGVSVTPTGSK